MRLGIIGYGTHGRHVEALALERHPEATVVVFDDPSVSQKLSNAHPFNDWKLDQFADLHFLVALGYHNLQLRVQIIHDLLALGRKVPPLVHPTAGVSRFAHLAEGVIISTMCAIGPHCTLEQGVFLSTGVVVSHDAVIGMGAHLGPGAVLAGQSEVGQYSFIGAGTTIANGRRVGNECRIGLAAAITRDVPDGKSAIGSPMRILDKQLSL